ncbi:MAG: exodeoxyribonuclease VII small subunit [Micropruina sp.]|nr:exodeoxyribonuclease VII small subunit [Micropruina sp.]
MTDQPQTPDRPQAAERPQTYEAARQRLIEVVQKLESGSVPLSSAMDLWHEGESLARQCQQWLDGARASIDDTLHGESTESSAD